jgi:hypothetical protein
MHRYLMITAAAIATTACRGDRQPPVAAGQGVLVTAGAPQSVAVDPGVVPVVGGCAEGELVRKTADGWSCGAQAELGGAAVAETIRALEAQLAAQRMRVEALESRAAGLSSQVAALEGALATKIQDDAAWPYTVSAATCVPSQDTVSAGILSVINGLVSLIDGATGRAVLYCPVIVLHPGQTWSRWGMGYKDGDGAGAAARVTARLQRLTATGQLETISLLDSNSNASSGPGELASPIGVAWAPERDVYFVELTIERASAATPVELFGVKVGG